MTEQWGAIVIAVVVFVAVFAACAVFSLRGRAAARNEQTHRSTSPLDLGSSTADQQRGAEQSRLLNVGRDRLTGL